MKIPNFFTDMDLNNHQKVLEFHNAFGLLISNEPYLNIFTEKPEVVQLRYSLIHEEYNELITAVNDKHLEEVIDALMDILYVLYGAAISYGVKTIINDYKSYIQSIQDFSFHYKGLNVQIEALKLSLGHFEVVLEKFKSVDNITQAEKLINEMIVITYYMCLRQSFDVDYCFNLVHQSNMSKLCGTETLAQQTVKWYKENQTVYDSPAYRYNPLINLWVVYNKSSGKILKSIEYFPVSFKDYLATKH